MIEDTGPQGQLFPMGPAGLPASTKAALKDLLAELKDIRSAL